MGVRLAENEKFHGTAGWSRGRESIFFIVDRGYESNLLDVEKSAVSHGRLKDRF